MAVAAAGGIGTATVAVPRSVGESQTRLARLVVAAPDLMVSAVAGFSLGPMILLLAGHYSVLPVLTTGLLGAAIAVRICGVPSEPVDRRTVLWTVAAGALLLAWFLANVGFSAQNVYATRDPATYDITARWLMDHPSLHIATHPEIFGAPAGSFAGSAGFSPVNATQLYAQGNHLMPALATVGGWLFGLGGLFKTNVVFGTVALLALFGLARRIVGAPFALLATAVMAVSMPMIYVSRDTYSEPLMMLVLLGALGLLHRAVHSRRFADFGLAGFVAGCSAMVRIDSYGALLSIIIAAAAVAGLADKIRRRHAVGCAVIMLAGVAVPTLVGWLDLTKLSYGYYRDQRHNIILEVEAGALVLVLAALGVALLWRPRVRTWLGAETTRRRLSSLLGLTVVAAFLLLLSRPLWMTGHGPMNRVLARWQAESGRAVDGTRTYSERTLYWLGQYLGWPTVLLGVPGYLLLLRALVRRRDYALVGVLSMGLTMSALYLWTSEITPDQPWAMRRYVPVIMPLMLVATVVALVALARQRHRWARPSVAALAVVAVGFPLFLSARVWGVREEYGQLAQLQAICAAVGVRGAVVEVDPNVLAGYGQSLRSYCDVPSIGLVDATPAQLARMNGAVAAHGRRLFVLSQNRNLMPFAPRSTTMPFASEVVPTWPNLVERVPSRAGSRRTTIYLATVTPDGRVMAVQPARARQ